LIVNRELRPLVSQIPVDDEREQRLLLAFGLACANRIRPLLEDPRAIDALALIQSYLDGDCDQAALEVAARDIAEVARSHPGSKSIDGSGHAAVSATHAVARALAGQAIEAAEYAAYATVYAYSGHAVNEPSSFDEEYAWQDAEFRRLSQIAAVHAGK
jgi:hypothetical protein